MLLSEEPLSTRMISNFDETLFLTLFLSEVKQSCRYVEPLKLGMMMEIWATLFSIPIFCHILLNGKLAINEYRRFVCRP